MSEKIVKDKKVSMKYLQDEKSSDKNSKNLKSSEKITQDEKGSENNLQDKKDSEKKDDLQESPSKICLGSCEDLAKKISMEQQQNTCIGSCDKLLTQKLESMPTEVCLGSCDTVGKRALVDRCLGTCDELTPQEASALDFLSQGELISEEDLEPEPPTPEPEPEPDYDFLYWLNTKGTQTNVRLLGLKWKKTVTTSCVCHAQTGSLFHVFLRNQNVFVNTAIALVSLVTLCLSLSYLAAYLYSLMEIAGVV